MNAFQFAVIIAELTRQIAFVRFPDRAQTGTQQTGPTALRESAFIADKKGSVFQGFQVSDVRHQHIVSVIDRRLDLREGGVNDFFVFYSDFLFVRHLGKKIEPYQRVFLGNFHDVAAYLLILMFHTIRLRLFRNEYGQAQAGPQPEAYTGRTSRIAAPPATTPDEVYQRPWFTSGTVLRIISNGEF
jgi:hypothetical protein